LACLFAYRELDRLGQHRRLGLLASSAADQSSGTKMTMIAGYRIAGIGQAVDDNQNRLIQLVQFIAAVSAAT